jgi:hypothetical protein
MSSVPAACTTEIPEIKNGLPHEPGRRSAAELKDLARYLQALRLRTYERDSYLWVRKKAGFLDSYPPHRRIQLRIRDIFELFGRGIAALRYTCEDGRGVPSFEYIWDDKSYSLNSVHKSSRRNVRRNLGACNVRQIDFELLAKDGCAINRSVFERQGRSMQPALTDEVHWRNYIRVCQTLPFLEPYGVFVKGRLCAFCIALLVDDYCYIVHPHASTEYFDRCPTHVLVHTLVETMLARPEVRCVSAGLEPFLHRPNVERFKLAMGCRKAPIRRRLFLNPLARPLFSRIGAPFVQALLSHVKTQLGDDFAAVSQFLQRSQSASEVREDSSRRETANRCQVRNYCEVSKAGGTGRP